MRGICFSLHHIFVSYFQTRLLVLGPLTHKFVAIKLYFSLQEQICRIFFLILGFTELIFRALQSSKKTLKIFLKEAKKGVFRNFLEIFDQKIALFRRC